MLNDLRVWLCTRLTELKKTGLHLGKPLDASKGLSLMKRLRKLPVSTIDPGT
jgi:hypothetical protein